MHDQRSATSRVARNRPHRLAGLAGLSVQHRHRGGVGIAARLARVGLGHNDPVDQRDVAVNDDDTHLVARTTHWMPASAGSSGRSPATAWCRPWAALVIWSDLLVGGNADMWLVFLSRDPAASTPGLLGVGQSRQRRGVSLVLHVEADIGAPDRDGRSLERRELRRVRAPHSSRERVPMTPSS